MDHFWKFLESVLRLLKKFRGIPSKIPCFPENLVTGKISLRIRYDSYIGIFRPFGTISEVFKKSSVKESVIPCFPESELRLEGLVYRALTKKDRSSSEVMFQTV